MIVLQITNNNLFMQQLLRGTLFDEFEVREVTLHTKFRLHLDGCRNKEFYNQDINDNLSDYIKWSEIKQHVFNLVKGSTSPTYFKIILSPSAEYINSSSDNISAFFLNISFKDNIIKCITGTSYKAFSLDKTPETVWDEKIKSFLLTNNLV